jgi:ABC-type nitrate/sulfonate/bicarbonate transport system permease component
MLGDFLFAKTILNWGLRDQAKFFGRQGNVSLFDIQNLYRKVILGAFIIVVLISLWWSIVRVFDVAPYLLPSPKAVFLRLIGDFGLFGTHLAMTAMEAVVGWVIGCGFGAAAGIFLHGSKAARATVLPVLIGLQSVPIIAIAPLLILWLGPGLASKIAMAAIICFVPVSISLLVAFNNVEREYRELFALYKAGYFVTMRRLLIPSSATALLSGLKIASGLAVVGAIVAEMTGADRGIGYLILNGSYRLETDLMFAAVLLAALLGFLFYHLPDLLAKIMPRRWGGAWVRGNPVKGE